MGRMRLIGLLLLTAAFARGATVNFDRQVRPALRPEDDGEARARRPRRGGGTANSHVAAKIRGGY